MVNDERADASNQEDLEWLERFQSGNVRAFDFFVRKYQRRLYAILYNMTSCKEDAADLLQETFVKAFRALGNFKGQSRFYTWLYRIAINTALNFLESHKKRSALRLESWSDEGKVADFLMIDKSVPAGDRSVLLNELKEKLNESLQKLSSIHRTVVILFEIEGMSHAEIAKTLHCSEGTVRSRLHYAKEQLKQFLSDYLKDETTKI